MMEELWEGGGCQNRAREGRQLRSAQELFLPREGERGELQGGPKRYPVPNTTL